MRNITKRLVGFGFVLIMVLQLNANPVDSLMNLVESSSGIKKFELQQKLIKEYRNQRLFDEAIHLSKDALDLADKLSDKRGKSQIYILIGKCLISNYQESEALGYFQQSLEISEANNYYEETAEAIKEIGRINYYNSKYDSALKYLNQSLEISIANNYYKGVGESYEFIGRTYRRMGKVDTALIIYTKSLEAQKQIPGDEGYKNSAGTLNSIGLIYYSKGDYEKAITAYTEVIELYKKINDPHGQALALTNTGNVYFYWGKYESALGYYQQALGLFEKVKYEEGVANCYSGMGLIYVSLISDDYAFEENHAKYVKAREFHRNSLEIYRRKNKKSGIANEIANLANVELQILVNNYTKDFGEFWEDSLYIQERGTLKDNHKVVLDLSNEAYEMRKEANDINGMAYSLNQIGKIHNYNAEFDLATNKLNESLKLAIEQDESYLMLHNYFALGNNSFHQKKYNQAIGFFNRAVELGTENDIIDLVKFSYHKLSKSYEAKVNKGQALRYYKLYSELKDKQFTEESRKVLTEMQTKYETDKVEQENKLLNNEKKLQESVIKRQNMLIAFFVVGFIIVVVFVFLLKREIRAKQKAFVELEEKNETISQQKEEIEDSIHYASRIQRAVVPSLELGEQILPEHFVLWRPRDIVSGDFYWFTQIRNQEVIVAADCTGHGVPGAFMSMLGVSFLTEIITSHFTNLKASLILNDLRDNVKQMLKQKGAKDEAKDGMDISLCILDRDNMKMQFAGAYNPLYRIRNGELEVFKADKMPIGIHVFEKDSFTNYELDIQKGDTYYIFSDGYVDQFGGPKGRKYMVKPFKNMLLEIQDMSMDDQKKKLEEVLDDWMGCKYLQIDDILVLGFRI